MGRSVSVAALGCILLFCAFLASCGHTQTTNVITNPVPTSVSLTSSPDDGLGRVMPGLVSDKILRIIGQLK